MQLHYDEKSADLVFAFRYIYNEIQIAKIDNGLTLTAEEKTYNGLAAILDYLQNTDYKDYAPKNTLRDVNEIKNRSTKQIYKKVDLTKDIDKITFADVFLYTRIYRGILECNSYNAVEMEYYNKLETKIQEKIEMQKIHSFDLLDIRVGKIVDIQEHPDADSLYVETVAIDNDGKTLNILSGLRKHATKSDLLNKKFLFLTNMKKAKLRGIESEGMILCIKNEAGLEIIQVADDVKEGTKVEITKRQV